MCAHVTKQLLTISYSEPGEVPRPPPVEQRDLLSSFSVVVRWNSPPDPNGVILRYIVNYVAVSSTPSQDMRRRRRETDGVRNECILGGQMNVNRNMIVDGTQTTATLTELSEYIYNYKTHINTHQLVHLTVTVCGFPNLAPDTVYEFRVQAETALGPGPFSNSTPFRTPENVMIIVVSIQLAF